MHSAQRPLERNWVSRQPQVRSYLRVSLGTTLVAKAYGESRAWAELVFGQAAGGAGGADAVFEGEAVSTRLANNKHANVLSRSIACEAVEATPVDVVAGRAEHKVTICGPEAASNAVSKSFRRHFNSLAIVVLSIVNGAGP